MPAAAERTPLVSVHPFRLTAPCPWHLLAGRESVSCWNEGREAAVWFAVGRTRSFSGLDDCRQWLASHPSVSSDLTPRCFALIAFDPADAPRTLWAQFPVRQFILPRILIRWQAGEATGWTFGEDSSQRALDLLLTRSAMHMSRRAILSDVSSLSRPEWRTAVDTIKSEIGRGTLQKAVLSRAVTLSADHPFDPAVASQTLAAATEDSIVFAYHQPGAGVFLGATPERLFSLRQNHLVVDSLAGTRPRGGDTVEDQRLALELSGSAKDLREQEFVTRHVTAALRQSCDHVHADEVPQVRQYASVQHLRSEIHGELRAGASLDELLTSLHPTPATCGLPVSAAREWIRKLEPDPRGLYAGLIGWIDSESAEFAVMIRSGLIQGTTARLFGGAGIVADSDPDAEFDECEWKMEPLRRALLSDGSDSVFRPE